MSIFAKSAPPFRFVEPIVNWKPRLFNESKLEIFPAVLEMETSPFRHGPPGCEDVIRSIYERMETSVLEFLTSLLSSESNASRIEATLYMIGQCLESVMMDVESIERVFIAFIPFISSRNALRWLSSLPSSSWLRTPSFKATTRFFLASLSFF